MSAQYDSIVNSFYLAYYGRPADAAGLAFWSQQLARTGGNFSQIGTAFATSAEATARFDGSDARSQLAQIYQDLFHRAPDPAGLDFWAQAVDAGRLSLADAALAVTQGAQGSDKSLSQLRQGVADAFTAEVTRTAGHYSGQAAVEAARLLVQAVTLDTPPADTQAMVSAAVKLAHVASDTPAVLEALISGGKLTALLALPKAAADPAALLQVMAGTAQLAAGDPATLETLLRGGGMQKVLQNMPATASLDDVAAALEHGGLAAAVDVVYPSTPPVEAPTFDVALAGGVLTVSGTATDAVLVDLTADTVTRGGTLEPLANAPDLTDVVASGYGGQVTVAGTVAELGVALAQAEGVDAYRIADLKSAIFSGQPGTRGFVSPEVADLVNHASALKLGGVLSAEERGLLDALDQFDMATLDASIDSAAPAPGVLGFTGLVMTGTGTASGITNDDTFGLSLAGAEQDAAVSYEVSHSGAANDWAVVDGTSGLANGTWMFRARVVDAAGNVAFSNQIQVTIDKTAPVLTGISYGSHDGLLGLGETVTLVVAFDKAVQVQGAPTLALAGGGNATYVSGAGSNTLVFSYTVQAGEHSADLATAASGALTGTITDLVGNALAANSADALNPAGTLVVDGIAPAQTFSFAGMDQDGGDSPDTQNDLVTNQPLVSLQATLSAPLGAGETVQYAVDGGAWSTDGLTVDGVDVTVAGLDASASPQLSLRVRDAAGNTGGSSVLQLVHDVNAPETAVTFSSLAHGSGASVDPAAAWITRLAHADIALTLDAPLNAGEYLQYRVDGGNWSAPHDETVAVESTAVTLSGVDVTASPTVWVRVVDAAGNAGTAVSHAVVFDNQVAPLQVALHSDTAGPGGSAADGVSQSGAWDVLGQEAGARLEYSDDGLAWSGVAPVSAEGAHGFWVRQVDLAGNVSAATQFSYLQDSVAPDAPLAVLRTDTGGSGADAITSDGVVLVSGLEGGTTVLQWTLDGNDWTDAAVANGAATVDLSGSGDGAKHLTLRQVDLAGNLGQSGTLDFTLDTTAPDDIGLAFSSVEGANGTPGATALASAHVYFQFASAIGSDATLQWRLAGGSWADVAPGAIDSQANTVTLGPLDLSASDPVVELRQVDAAGNVANLVSQQIDGPAVPFSFGAAPEGLALITSVAGDLSLYDPVAQHGTPLVDGAPAGSLTIGVQESAASGYLTLTPASGVPASDATVLIGLGSLDGDALAGQYLWGFDGEDTLTGTSAADVLSGGLGADRIDVGAADGKIDTVRQGAHDSAGVTGGAITEDFLDTGDTIVFGAGVDVVTGFQAGIGGDQLDVVSGGGATSAYHSMYGTGWAFLEGVYFVSGSFDADTRTFTVAADGVGADTMIVQGEGGATFDTNDSAVILVGVNSADLVPGNLV